MTSFTITPLAERTGAEVVGLDFRKPIDREIRETLNRAFAAHHVLVMAISASLPTSSSPPFDYSASFSRTTKKNITSRGTPMCLTFPTTSL